MWPSMVRGLFQGGRRNKPNQKVPSSETLQFSVASYLLTGFVFACESRLEILVGLDNILETVKKSEVGLRAPTSSSRMALQLLWLTPCPDEFSGHGSVLRQWRHLYRGGLSW